MLHFKSARIPGVDDPCLLRLRAGVTFQPAMRPDDLAQAGARIAAAVKKSG
jgi:hypothetical protein